MRTVRLAMWAAIFSAGTASAQEATSAPASTPNAPNEDGEQSAGRDPGGPVVIPQGVGFPADDAVRRLEPRVESPSSDADRTEAVSHFMAGQILEKRRDLVGALAQYEEAVALDATSYRLLSSYVPLSYLLGEEEKAIERAFEAAARIEEGHTLVRALAGVMADRDQPQKSIELLNRLLDVPMVREDRLRRLLVTRDVAVLHQAQGNVDAAADRFAIVFDALQSTDEPLSEADRAALVGDAGGAYEAFGQAFLKAERPELAVRAFEEASKARPGRPAVHAFNLAGVFRKTGQPEKALSELDKYLAAQLQSKGVTAYEMLAELYGELGRESELLPRLKDLVSKDRRNPTLRYFYADRLFEAGDVAEAKTQYQTALGGGRDLRGLTGLLGVARRQDEPETAYDLLLKAYPIVARAEDPEGPFATEWEAMKADETFIASLAETARERLDDSGRPLEPLEVYVTGRLMIDADRLDDAAAFFRRAMLEPGAARFQLAYEVSEPLMRAGQYEPAASVLRLVVEDEDAVERTLPAAYFLLGNALAFDGKTDEGIEAIRRAQELDGDTAQWFFQEALYRGFAKEYEEAERLFNAFILRFEESDESGDAELVMRSRYQLSSLYVQQGQVDRGADILLAILEENPDDTQANNDLGYLWADAGIRLDEAETMIRRALSVEPDNAAYLDSLGWVLFRKGDADAAIEPLEKAAAQEDRVDGVILEHLGDAYRAVGREEDAVAQYERALELLGEETRPDEDQVQRIRGKLAGEVEPSVETKPAEDSANQNSAGETAADDEGAGNSDSDE